MKGRCALSLVEEYQKFRILVGDLISYAQLNNMSLALTGIDLEKAYDRLAHSFLFKVFKEMGIPLPFLKTLKGLYTNIMSQAVVNGNLTDFFPFGLG